jgi:integrase
MRGRIYSDQKCSLCGSAFQHDDRRRGLFCFNHPDQEATRSFKVRFGRDITKRFKTYLEAERFLDGLRYEVDKGTFDVRDYQANNPLGFSNLAKQWLLVKEKEVRPGSFKNLRNYINRASEFWDNRNIKLIQYADLEDFFHSLPLSDKSKSNAKSCLHSFWCWLLKRQVLKKDQFPDFPEISFELGWRKTIDKETQIAVIDEIKRISWVVNPKIWIGIKWLATYISIRPLELINIQEKNIDRKSGFLFIPHPKEKRPKIVPLIDEDIELLSLIPAGFPDLYFFRHAAGISGCRPGDQFGKRYLYKWWVKACENLGVEGVDLYGGTRHSSVIALTEFATPEQIKAGTMHTTNKAFERYYRIGKSELKGLYNLTNAAGQTDQRLTNQSSK